MKSSLEKTFEEMTEAFPKPPPSPPTISLRERMAEALKLKCGPVDD